MSLLQAEETTISTTITINSLCQNVPHLPITLRLQTLTLHKGDIHLKITVKNLMIIRMAAGKRHGGYARKELV